MPYRIPSSADDSTDAQSDIHSTPIKPERPTRPYP
jgi:hypothetical protein